MAGPPKGAMSSPFNGNWANNLGGAFDTVGTQQGLGTQPFTKDDLLKIIPELQKAGVFVQSTLEFIIMEVNGMRIQIKKSQ